MLGMPIRPPMPALRIHWWFTMRFSLRGMMWRWLEPKVQAAVTDRLISFHAALIERGEITPQVGLVVTRDGTAHQSEHLSGVEYSSEDCRLGSGRVLPFSGHRPHQK